MPAKALFDGPSTKTVRIMNELPSAGFSVSCDSCPMVLSCAFGEPSLRCGEVGFGGETVRYCLSSVTAPDMMLTVASGSTSLC